jgi:hypothetical protein
MSVSCGKYFLQQEGLPEPTERVLAEERTLRMTEEAREEAFEENEERAVRARLKGCATAVVLALTTFAAPRRVAKASDETGDGALFGALLRDLAIVGETGMGRCSLLKVTGLNIL